MQSFTYPPLIFETRGVVSDKVLKALTATYEEPALISPSLGCGPAWGLQSRGRGPRTRTRLLTSAVSSPNAHPQCHRGEAAGRPRGRTLYRTLTSAPQGHPGPSQWASQAYLLAQRKDSGGKRPGHVLSLAGGAEPVLASQLHSRAVVL